LKGQDGLLKQCVGGTIFIDEFADLTPEMQVFLLDVAEGQQVSPIGPRGEPFKPEVHFVLATNKDVKKSIREDLRHRIQATIHIPALAERIEDIFPLVRHALDGTNFRLDFRTWLLLLTYPWPGNVRELQIIVADALVRMQVRLAGSVDPKDRPAEPPSSSPPPSPPPAQAEVRSRGRPERVPLPFELVAGLDTLQPLAAKGWPTEPEAIRRVAAFLEGVLRKQGYEKGKKGQGLHARIAELVGVTPSWLTRHLGGAEDPGESAGPCAETGHQG
jgi:transcriptional regulator with AAA-type ATPase domain